MVEEVVSLPFLCNIWQLNNFFACHSCLIESSYSLRITTVNSKMWCDIFYLFVGRNKKKKTCNGKKFQVKRKHWRPYCRLYCLFRYFKNMRPLLLTLISLHKYNFLPSCCWTEKNLFFHKRGVDLAGGMVLFSS